MDTTKKFTGKSEAYEHYRPGYPEAFIDYLLASCGLEGGGTAADVGAGTGILSRQLLEKGLKVIAVEPNDDMREKAQKNCGSFAGFTAVGALAEDTGLADRSVDLVTAAQAFHWFDAPRFKKECGRILKEGGRVALVWNNRDIKSPLVTENAEICARFCPEFGGFSNGREQGGEVFASFFKEGAYVHREFRNDLVFDLEGFVGRNLSSSYAPREGGEQYGPFVEALEKLFEKYGRHGRLTLPNVTDCFIGGV